MRIRIPSRISPSKAIELQKKLAPLVEEASPTNLDSLKYLIGCDATYLHGLTLAAATLVERGSMDLTRVKAVKEPTRFPYVPGLLAFREAPAVLRAIRALNARSFICLVDGHGLAHPRGFGLACFVGLVLDQPTVGVAKSLLYGSLNGNAVRDEGGRAIAEVVTLPRSNRAIYVSVGHRISLKDAVRTVKKCLGPKGPIPISLAHDEVSKRKWMLKRSSQAS